MCVIVHVVAYYVRVDATTLAQTRQSLVDINLRRRTWPAGLAGKPSDMRLKRRHSLLMVILPICGVNCDLCRRRRRRRTRSALWMGTNVGGRRHQFPKVIRVQDDDGGTTRQAHHHAQDEDDDEDDDDDEEAQNIVAIIAILFACLTRPNARQRSSSNISTNLGLWPRLPTWPRQTDKQRHRS